MVKAGNRMWNEMTKPNWIRDSNSASTRDHSDDVAQRRVQLCAASLGLHAVRNFLSPMTHGPIRQSRPGLLPCAGFVHRRLPNRLGPDFMRPTPTRHPP